jgi:hypothetical protein
MGFWGSMYSPSVDFDPAAGHKMGAGAAGYCVPKSQGDDSQQFGMPLLEKPFKRTAV